MQDNLEEDVETPEEENSQEEDQDGAADEGLLKRYKDQITGSKQEAERLRKMVIEAEVKKAAENAESLEELNAKDPKLANEVAKRFGYENFEEASKVIVKQDHPTEELVQKKVGLTEDEFEKLYQKRQKREEHEKSLKKAETMLNELDEETREKAKLYFDKIVGNKTLDRETATEFAEMATLYVSKGKLKLEKRNDGLVQLGSTGLSQGSGLSKATNSEGGDLVIVDGRLVTLKSNKQ